jgi:uncharacterized tellurite resistance protein B-like protein
MNKTQMLNTLVQLATADNELAGRESSWITQLGSKLGLSAEEIATAFRSPLPPPDFGALAEEERFEYLYNLIQLMKIDGKVFTSEITFCERFATKLGYKSSVVKALSAYIYSDPSITADRQMLHDKARKHLHS